jgi:hypothetical protein
MAIDVTSFYPVNVTDTCAVWNLLSSRTLYRTAKSAGCHFCCTTFVDYECLFKKRSAPTQSARELHQRLRNAKKSGDFQVHSVAVEDLIDDDVLSKRQHIGKGELSSMVFARKTRQALLTDDQRARKLAIGLLDAAKVQTTPHLAGWLFFVRQLIDGDLAGVISEHDAVERPLAKHFQAAHEHAMRARLGQLQPQNG